MESTQAACTQVHTGRLPVDIDCCRMDIRYPFPIGMPLRMTYVMTELWRFTANITFHFIIIPLDR